MSHFTVSHTKNVAHLSINNPKSNSWSRSTYLQFKEILIELDNNSSVKAIVFSGTGKHFSSGLDLKSAVGGITSLHRKARNNDSERQRLIKQFIGEFQDAISTPTKIKTPIIVVAHGACVGLALDVIATTSIRFVCKDAFFAIPEIKMGFPADIGALQRLYGLVNNKSKFSELVLTGDKFGWKLAFELGLFSRVFDTKNEAIDGAMKVANQIAKSSTAAISGTKLCLSQMAEGEPVEKGLQFVRAYNGKHLPGPEGFVSKL